MYSHIHCTYTFYALYVAVHWPEGPATPPPHCLALILQISMSAQRARQVASSSVPTRLVASSVAAIVATHSTPMAGVAQVSWEGSHVTENVQCCDIIVSH